MRKLPNETPERVKGPVRPERGRGAQPSEAEANSRSARKGVSTSLDTNGCRSDTHVPERTCILSRRTAPRDELIRLALSPDGEVLPDVRAKAAGRGAWIGVDRPTLEAAQSKGKLRGALARAFKTGELSVPDDLGARIEAALEKATLDRLGLEARAGNLASGAERIESAARKGQVRLLLHASDASTEGRRRLDQAWRVGLGEEGSGRQGVVFPKDRSILSLALGRENVVHVAIVDGAAAARVLRALERWRAFIGRDAALGTASAEPDGASPGQVSEGI